MRRIKTIVAAMTVLVGSSAAMIAPVNAEKLLQGQVCEENVHKLTSDIEWYKSLHKAEKAAADQNKLILWIHMVGKIDGAT